MVLINYDWICDHPPELGQKEDEVIIKERERIFAVLDGFNAPYNYKNPTKFFKGRTGGEMVVQTIKETFLQINSVLPLENGIFFANMMVKKELEKEGLSLKNAGLIPAASFVFAKIEEDSVRFVQGGDCLAVWQFNSGEIGFTHNQAYLHVALNLQTIKEIMEGNGGNRKEMWAEFAPTLSQRRQQDINNSESETGYAAINGQPSITKCWQKMEIPLKGLKTILLFSDGFIHYDETNKEKLPIFTEKLFKDYLYGREFLDLSIKATLERMLARKREEKMDSKTSHVDRDEATAIALEFDADEKEKSPVSSQTVIKALCPV